MERCIVCSSCIEDDSYIGDVDKRGNILYYCSEYCYEEHFKRKGFKNDRADREQRRQQKGYKYEAD